MPGQLVSPPQHAFGETQMAKRRLKPSSPVLATAE
ncbi:hypothetical protein ALP50_200012 [Pseudomonas syringae pv. spinaceae]|nr:hypothetical protein ALP50_200012 [Pseudomonas syringae pv. spinaceae]SOP99741.1 hypothetical protein CFBP4215_02731 [Pseudomonas syringae pv. syringae]